MTTVNGVYTPSPKPHPRRTPEAERYALRDRDATESWFDPKEGEVYVSPRPVERLQTEDAKRNAATNKGCMPDLMGGYADPVSVRAIHPRRPQANGTTEGGAMRNLMDNYGNLGLTDRPVQRVKGGEAEENATRNHGTVDHLLNNYSNSSDSPQRPHVQDNGEEDRDPRGAGMGALLRMEGTKTPRDGNVGRVHQESQDSWDQLPPAHRTRPDGEQIAVRQSQSSMTEIMRMDGKQSQRPGKMPQHLTVTEEKRPKTSPVRTRPEAYHYYEKNKVSEVASIMKGEASPTTPTGRKSNSQLFRSEEW